MAMLNNQVVYYIYSIPSWVAEGSRFCWWNPTFLVISIDKPFSSGRLCPISTVQTSVSGSYLPCFGWFNPPSIPISGGQTSIDGLIHIFRWSWWSKSQFLGIFGLFVSEFVTELNISTCFCWMKPHVWDSRGFILALGLAQSISVAWDFNNWPRRIRWEGLDGVSISEGACAHTFAAFTIGCHMGYAQTPLMVQKMQLRSRKQLQQAAMTSWLLNQHVDPSKWLMAKSLGKAWVSNISTSDFRPITALALLEHHHIRFTGLIADIQQVFDYIPRFVVC